MRKTLSSCLLVVALCAASGIHAQQPLLSSTERARARDMLNAIKTAVRNDYYDKAFHGLDLDSHFKAAQTKIETAVSPGTFTRSSRRR